MNRIATAKLKAEIAKYIINGLRNKDICKLLNISKQRVNYYKKLIERSK